jgi:hypothetical protein
MSLINDALRRASQSERGQTESPPPLPVGLRTADFTPLPPPVPLSPWPALLKLVGVVVLALCLVGGGGFLLHRAWAGHRPVVQTDRRSQPLVVSPSQGAPTQKAFPNPVTSNAPAALPTGPPPSNLSTASVPLVAAVPQPKVAPPQTPEPLPPQPAKWPTLRLQGIFFRPPNSSVVINSKTLYQDDEIQGVRIAEIDSHGVTVTLGGQTNVLHLR